MYYRPRGVPLNCIGGPWYCKDYDTYEEREEHIRDELFLEVMAEYRLLDSEVLPNHPNMGIRPASSLRAYYP